MKNLGLLFLFLLLFQVSISQSYKNSNKNKADSTPSTKGMNISKNPDDSVLTPFGLFPRSNIYMLDKESYINVENKKIQVVHSKSGEIQLEFDKPDTYPTNTSSDELDKYESGYITGVAWSNRSTNVTSFFSATWHVPSPPTKDNGQTIFIFNALENGPDIIQPVLQWGGSAAGGGPYWGIANWYLTDWGNKVFISPLIRVFPGTKLVGTIKLTNQSINSFSYNSSFEEYPGSELQVNNARKFYDALISLETYFISRCGDYPSDMRISINDIKMKTDTITPFLNWRVQKYRQVNCGQYTLIRSYKTFGDGVDIHFCNSCRDEPFATPINAKTDILFYPNPAGDFLQISFNRLIENCKIEIYNSYGVLNYSGVEKNILNTNLDIKNLSAGLYILNFKFEQNNYSYKFIKN